MKVGVLTSSRADYSIYYPLLHAISEDPFFSLELLAFGTHLSKTHGYTIEKIRQDGFNVNAAFETVIADDSPSAISQSMAKTLAAFSSYWPSHQYDLVFALGDRYEMFSACASLVPFGLPLAHLHGGEETRGAIDDCFRHSITHMASIHFTAAQAYRDRVAQLKGSSVGVFNVGSLSIDNLKNLQLLSIAEFNDRFGINLETPSILITFHPETVSFEKNTFLVDELISALDSITGYQFVITMPNADTMGNIVREKLLNFVKRNTSAVSVESFGTIGYLSCMKHCAFMMGNTSSGFIEASYFPKYVINLGERQRGRIVTANIVECPIERTRILDAVHAFKTFSGQEPVDIYGDGTTAEKIVAILKSIAKGEFQHGGL